MAGIMEGAITAGASSNGGGGWWDGGSGWASPVVYEVESNPTPWIVGGVVALVLLLRRN
jgi:hypothetical protein